MRLTETLNFLQNYEMTSNIRTVAELARQQPYELFKVKGAGKTVLRECARELKRHGLYLGMPLN